VTLPLPISNIQIFSHLKKIKYSAFDNYFLQAQRLRQCIRDDFMRVFCVPDPLSAQSAARNEAGVHILLHPSAVRTAPRLDEEQDGLDAYTQDVLTVPASLAGLPALSVPIASSGGEGDGDGDGWPLGVSVVGQWGCERMALAVGATIEDAEREVLQS
jgi:aspartyl-tRNA(Asn)/glutamyl-tRNA(Gln) amidotransferase subunit A